VSLKKIIVVLVAIVVAAYFVYRGLEWYNDEYLGQALAATAADDIETAQAQLDAGKHQEAIQTLAPLLERPGVHTFGPDALMLSARAAVGDGRPEAAESYLARLVRDYPSTPLRVDALMEQAALAREAGQNQRAVEFLEQVRQSAPSEARAPALVALAELAIEADEPGRAHALLMEAVDAAERGSSAWGTAMDHLGEVNVARIFSPAETPESRVYVVEPGDNLTAIGNKLNVPQGMLIRANRMDDASQLQVGQRLKYTPKDFRVVIERSTCTLYLMDADGIFKRYQVGLGMPGYETTLGSYKIGTKQKDPAWWKPGEGMIPAGDPANELGTRWMPLVPLEEGLPDDLGIHGTIAPDTVGGFTSHGCARLTNENVEELYDLIVRSTPVEIVETMPSPGGDSAPATAQTVAHDEAPPA
jgi:lipoprotein-anchoring transpeptidase ErfK/SrfK